ncbi:copper amine oxidase N-terminal domain-containing protein [Brevibacillus laterosporus]|uniref:copper amine oxidase N-terminal domain-containing protein n=2 Tax=Brevibacillus laterosporus TaxID=1465 RepID=UPI00112799F2|nr:copper amine oxidase N-terminal domain-containing protein [Brevibacillus laterosporus]MED1790556.1 copper amine oxidase N-terminal domain-containing protein [Brevibacillus laterosporus]MED4762083.1 copper amine oxidase N-terminal domain-containing protein [Brevibacillus laterosporus]TPH09944.1 copper amine oxidase N-terminal domain-containing protein [Brevibacillus laterosporus]
MKKSKSNFRKLIGMSICASLGLGIAIGVISSEVKANGQGYDIRVQVDKKDIEFPDAKPYLNTSNNRTMIPVRFVSEALGSKVDWDQKNQKVTLNKDGKVILLKIGEKKALINGQEITFDAQAVVKDARTYVPLRFVSESFEARVSWSNSEKLVRIYTKNWTGAIEGDTGNTSKGSTNSGSSSNNGLLPLPGGNTSVKPPVTGYPSTGGTGGVFDGSQDTHKPPMRPGQAENVEAMKEMVKSFKVEDGILKGKIDPKVKGFVLVQFIPDDNDKDVAKTKYLKPNAVFELKLTDSKGLIELHGQNETDYGTVSIDYPSLKILSGW